MQKYAIISLIIAIIATPAMATNGLVTETNNGCDNAILNTYDGDVNLSADWSPNNIILKWYNDNLEYSQNTCEYGGNITLPIQPTRDGYTFGGWAVRTPCVLSDLYVPAMDNEEPIHAPQYVKWEPIVQDGFAMNNAFSGSPTSGGLSAGEWSVKFTEGTIKGRALCSSTNGIYAQSDIPNETGGGQYCWCAGTDFDNSCPVASPSWVFYHDYSASNSCANNCAALCAMQVRTSPDFRRAIFGVTE